MAGPGQADERNHAVPAAAPLLMPLTSLIGRIQELEGLGDALRRVRLVTLTGPGGVGKTRVAVELARRQLGRRDDVWLVDLTATTDDADVAPEVARTLDLRTVAPVATDALRRYLDERDGLLVLDNCEHVLGGCAELAAALLGSCATLRVLATSREPLDVDGETVWRLDPLETDDAHRLFVERARQRQPQFIPSEEMDVAIGKVCERLDCLPLAIELAAARISAMSPLEILTGLEARLGELGGRGRLAPAHHRSVRATVEWSYRLLDPIEQRAFRSLAVFVGGFDAAAAGSVAEPSLDVLARLVDKSLISASEGRRGRTRYRLLETVREYASDLLVETGELQDARDRHLRHFAALGGAARDRDGWPTATARELVDELEDDYENVRSALEWAAGRDPCAARAPLAAMHDLFMMLGQADGLHLGRLVLERCVDQDRDRAELQISVGLLTMLLAETAQAKQALAEARELSVALGERSLEAWALFFQGLTATLEISIEPGRELLEAARALHQELGIRAGEARATAALGLNFELAGEGAHGQEFVEAALAIAVAECDRWSQGQSHLYLGIIAESIATHADVATSHYRQAVEALRPFRDASLLPFALIGQASVIASRDPATALEVVAAAFALRTRGGGQFPPAFRVRADRVRSAVEAALGPEADRIWRAGGGLGVDDAIALAFGLKRPRPDGAWGLSARELDVARLVADGLANKEIGTRLHVSVRTVESHVRHVLTKTGLTNRTQLATWARERMQ